jgi:hypothetical protein
MEQSRRWILFSKKNSKFFCSPTEFTFAFTYTNDVMQASRFTLNEVYNYFTDNLFSDEEFSAIELNHLVFQRSPHNR